MTPINQQRNQKELPDLIQCTIDEGKSIHSFEICDWYLNINDKNDLELAKSYFSNVK